MKKLNLIFINFILITCLVGCSGKVSVPDNENSLSVSKKGNITQYIKEEFKENYYNINELNDAILDEISVFNAKYGENEIVLKKAQMSSKYPAYTDIELAYASCGSYVEFNDCILFIGTGQEAFEKGFLDDVILSNIKDATSTLDKESLSKSKEKVLITNLNDVIILPSKVKYISSGCTVMNNNLSVKKNADHNGLVYIVY